MRAVLNEERGFFPWRRCGQETLLAEFFLLDDRGLQRMQGRGILGVVAVFPPLVICVDGYYYTVHSERPLRCFHILLCCSLMLK